jgi:hypothetical protein
VKDKYYSTNMKPNKCIRQTFFKPHIEKYEKVLNLGGCWSPTPVGDDPTMTNIDGWLDLDTTKVYKAKRKILKE